MKMVNFSMVVLMLLALGCQSSPDKAEQEATERSQETTSDREEVAVLAGGCFWCMQPPFDELEGVIDTRVGYSGGSVDAPTYEAVSSGQTDHLEAVEVRFDGDQISYEEVLDVFWRSIDPTDDGGQFADRGDHYRTAIFVADEAQREVAQTSKRRMDDEGPFDDPVVTEIREAGEFWVGEEYHQDYYKKNPRRYNAYYEGSGRAPFLREIWGEE